MRHSLPLFAVGCAAALGNVQAQIHAYDTATPSYIEFSAPRFEVDGCETNAVVTVVRTGDFRKAATVEYSTREGTAAENVDFRPCGGAIVFAPGQSFKNINIPIVRGEPGRPKTFQVELTSSAATSSVVVITSSAEVEIKSAPPELAIGLGASGVTVSWADVGLPFRLESLMNGNWSGVESAAVLRDGAWNVQIGSNAQVELFRLRLDPAE